MERRVDFPRWYINCYPFLSLVLDGFMSKEVILIFDQDPHIQWVLKTLLEGERYIVIAHGEMDRLRQNFKEFEISALLFEYRPDQKDLIDFIRELKRNFCGLYIMALTQMEVSDHQYKLMFNAGVDDLFLKPFSSEKILLHLRKGLRQRRLILQKRQMEKKLMKMKFKTKAIVEFSRQESILVPK